MLLCVISKPSSASAIFAVYQVNWLQDSEWTYYIKGLFL